MDCYYYKNDFMKEGKKMINWRKFVAIMLSALFIVTMGFTGVFAEEDAEAAPVETAEPAAEDTGYGIYAQAVHTLFRFGMLNEESFDKKAEVTRGAFVAAAVKLLGIGDVLKPVDTVFNDVGADNADSGAIAAAYNMGVISGYGDNTFRPGDALTKEQAAKILVSILGYDVHAKSYGGYPGGYLTIASMQGILKKVDNGAEKFTWDIAAQMIFNAMNADLLQMKSYPEAEYYTVKGENAMTKYMGIYLYEGTVNANSITSLSTGEGIKEGYVKIGDKIFLENGTGAFDLLGYPVEAYYKADDVGADSILMSVTVKSHVTEVVVSAKDIDDASTASELVYYMEGRVNPYKAKIVSSPYVISNGKLFVPQGGSFVYPEIGSVKLVDVNRDSVYDIVFIESYEVYVVEKVSAATGIIKDLYLMPNLVLDPADTDLKYTIIKDGEPLEFSKIKANDVLSVAKSQDGKYVKIIVCGDKLKGAVEEISEDIIVVDGNEYKILSTNRPEFNKLEVGARTTFYFTHDEIIAGFGSVTVSGEAYAYIYEGYYETQGLSAGETAQIRAFMADGSIKTLITSKDFKYNGQKYNDEGKRLNGEYLIDNVLSGFDSTIGKIAFKHQLVKITLDSEGLLTSITTATDNRVQKGGTGGYHEDFSIDYSFHTDKSTNDYNRDYDGTSSSWRYIRYKSMGLLKSKYITSGCIAINIPSDSAFTAYYKKDGSLSLSSLEKQFSTFSTSSWENDHNVYNVDLYDIDENRVIGVLVQWPYQTGGAGSATAASASEEFYIVDKIVSSIDGDGYPVRKLYGLYKGSAVGYEIDEEAPAFNTYAETYDLFNLKRGDVIRIALDATNKITNILKVFTFDHTAEGAENYILNGGQFDEWQARSDPRGFPENQGWPVEAKDGGNTSSYRHDITSTWVSAHRAIHARYYNVTGNMGEVMFGQTEGGAKPTNKILRIRDVYVYDEETDTVRLGSMDDIDPDDPRQTAVIRMRHSVGSETLLINRINDPGTLYWKGNYTD